MKNLLIGLLIAVIVFAAGWFLVNSGSKSAMSADDYGHMSDSQHGSVQSTSDIVECPVMGTKIPVHKAFAQTEYKGKTYYFCCAGCPGEFERNPEKYAK